MKGLGSIIRVAIAIATLFTHTASHASTRARSLAETVLDDSPVRLTIGGFHSCRVNEDGTVDCWGDNRQGQLGDGTTASRLAPVRVTGLTNAVALASGQGHTCAVLGDGTARCWGDNAEGQLGDGTTTDRLTPVPVTNLTNAVAITAAAFHTCALVSDGTARCWGNNGDGRLGDGTASVNRLTPVQVIGLARAVIIAAGGQHTCAIVANGGNAVCWGGNGFGQLGDGTTTRRLTPGLVSGVFAAVGITAGFNYTCAVIGDGTARCWGGNERGQLGDGSTTRRLTAVFVNGLPTRVTNISATSSTTCAHLADGTARCWGENQVGQIGDGTTTSPRLTPVPVSGLTNTVAVVGGHAHSCALLAAGSVRCWGSNTLGALGDGTGVNRFTAGPVAGGGGTNTARDVAAGGAHTCAVRANSTVACWGDNSAGQLGDGTTPGQLTPVAVPGLTNAVAIAAGEVHSCAVLADGTARCWGDNSAGQLGDGTTTRRITPVSVSGLSNVVGIATGDAHTCAVLGSGGVRCWGDNRVGQLGDGTTTRRPVPIVVTIVPIGAAPNGAAVAITAGSEHTCALLADGTERCWGGGGHGQLGRVGTEDRLTPTLVSITSAVAIAAGDFHTCSLRAEPISVSGVAPSVVFCSGANFSGSLGDGTIMQRTSPIPVPGLTTAVTIAGGSAHTCASLANGAARCWGDNVHGQIGDGTTTQRLSPTAVTITTTRSSLVGGFTSVSQLGSIVQIATGSAHSCARIANGSVRCWGLNLSGQVGIGTTTNVLRPAVVPSFTLNIDPLVRLHWQGRVATVDIVAVCDEGERLQVDVTLTQDGVSGHGVATGACTGGLERYPVTVPARGPTGFLEGAAQVQAEAIIGERGTAETQAWTRAVNIATP